MATETTFAEVLDQELAASRSMRSVPPSTQPARPSYAPPHPFLFARPAFQFKAAAYGSMSGAASAVEAARPIAPAPRTRPSRPLTVAQQRALDEVVRLGADLTAGFTARELRSAYCTLALRYHPDCHPSSNDTEKARLARVFADMNENHRRLLTALPAPAWTARR